MENLRLLLLPLCMLILYPFEKPETKMTFLDVGQGDCAYVSCGEAVLIDAGSSSDRHIGEYTVVPFLESSAVSSLDKVFVTHADADHTNGIEYILEEGDIGIERLYLPYQAKKDDAYDKLKNLCKKRKVEVEYLKAGDAVNSTRGSFLCLSPGDGEIKELNEQSLVIIYIQDEFTAFLMGDAGTESEKKLLERFSIPKAVVLKCGHHGSRNSTGEEFLKAADPLATVLSYGEGNRYGHPSDETLERLRQTNAAVIKTAESGAVSFTTDGKKVRVKTFVK